MGRADTATKNFMRQNDVFAAAFDFFLYQGYPVIDPGRLRELTPAVLGKGEFGKFQSALGEMREFIE